MSVVVFWSLLQLPVLWTFSTIDISCDGDEFTLLDQGVFSQYVLLKSVINYAWFILGFLVPVVLLAFCNRQLVLALRASYRMQLTCRINAKPPGIHITSTLVAIVLAYLILVSPSEIVNFYYFNTKTDAEIIGLVIVISNVLQTSNISLNFVLYCIVNSQFRDTVKSLLRCSQLYSRKCRYSQSENIKLEPLHDMTASTHFVFDKTDLMEN